MTVFITTLVSLTVLSLPWMHFTPTSQAVLLDLFSDFGAISGLSSFVLILSIIGLTFSWRKQRVVYWLLAITVASYLSNTHALFVLVIILSYFSAVALSRFSETEWKLKDLQTLTVFLLLLGLLFSNITFVDRVQGFSPTNEMKESLEWIKLDADNFEKGRWSVLSISQDEYFVNYYTQLKIFDHSLVHLRTDEIQQIDLSKLHEGQEIFSIPYPHILFPLLKEQNVRYVYLDASLKDILQEDEGVRFALRNERFKLLYSSGETEVWKFR